MPTIGSGCHELRVVDGKVTWRIVYHIAADAVVILDVFKKQTMATPLSVINASKRRLADFQRLSQTKKETGRAKR
jgi:phage-related protein